MWMVPNVGQAGRGGQSLKCYRLEAKGGFSHRPRPLYLGWKIQGQRPLFSIFLSPSENPQPTGVEHVEEEIWRDGGDIAVGSEGSL